MKSPDRIMMEVCTDIDTMGDRINIPRSIVGTARDMFKKVYESNCCKGHSNEAKATACLYIACRQERVPRTFKEICSVTKLSKKEIVRCYRLITRFLKAKVELMQTGDFMSRFCANLSLPQIVQKVATHIAETAVNLHIVAGRSPISVAAAAIYMASQVSQHKRTQKEIGEITGVSDGTIRHSFRLMHQHTMKLFPKDFKTTILPYGY